VSAPIVETSEHAGRTLLLCAFLQFAFTILRDKPEISFHIGEFFKKCAALAS
jgi:hypothetical protein